MSGLLTLELPGGLLLEEMPADPESCCWLQGIRGLDGVELRDSAEPVPDRDGESLGPVLRAARIITCEVLVVGADRAEVDERVQQLRAAARPVADTWPLLVRGRQPGPAELTIDVRPSQPFAEADRSRRTRSCQLVLKAPEPRLNDVEYRSAVIEPPGIEGGEEFPLVFGLDFAGAAYQGSAVEVRGDDSAWPLLEIHGPITDPVAISTTTGRQVAVEGTVASGQVLAIDPTRRTLTLVDGATRSDWYAALDRAASQWWALEPGVNQLGLTGTGVGTTTRMGVLWRDAYL